jgi:hypothetical protein
MIQLVQAQCPGCRRQLRIPADWVTQVMRCKHCGNILKARAPLAFPSPAARPSVPVNRPTPPPPSGPVAQLVAAPPGGIPLIAPAAMPVARAAIPVAMPVAPPPAAAPVGAPAASSPFSFDPGAEEETPSRRRRRRGSWTGPVIFLCVVGIAAGGTFFAWPHLQPILFPPDSKDDNRLARNDTSPQPATRPADVTPPPPTRKQPPASTPKQPPKTSLPPRTEREPDPPPPPPTRRRATSFRAAPSSSACTTTCTPTRCITVPWAPARIT